MALPKLDATFASSADLPRKQMLAKWLVEELGETQAPSSVLVSGAGSAFCNGIYVQSGESAGRPQYVKSGGGTIYWDSSSWLIDGNDEDIDYEANEDVAYPWLVTSWTISNGEEPVPTVTEVPQPSPISNYYSLPERYLWAKIAVAAGGPKTEAEYISLPKNYVWSDIYNAVSDDIAKSSIVISDAGSSSINGVYTYRGEHQGKPYYNLVGYEDSSLVRAIYWDADSWIISDENTYSMYFISALIDYPWSEGAEVWSVGSGDSPAPKVTPQTPNYIDMDMKTALGHIAASYRNDLENPANLATYIDWPWRYQVASIIDHLIGNYNAVIVSGAGTTELNGTYTKRGISDGKLYYNLIGSPNSVSSNSIYWTGESWLITSFDDGAYYESLSGEEFPWNATGWVNTNGSIPVPALTTTNV